MTPWLHVVGIGEDGLDGLAPAAAAMIAAAEVIVGGERHLAMLPEGFAPGAERRAWASPFAAGLDGVLALKPRRVCVLASGEPMWFGVGASLARRVPADEMVVAPHPGAFSLAAARLGWGLHEAVPLSMHGRPVAALALHLAPGARLLVLSEDGGSPARVAELLRRHGFTPSAMSVFERLGGPAERRRDGAAGDDWPRCDDLNLVAVDCRAAPGARVLGRVPGLPDDAFRHDGQITKAEIRAVTLAALAPWPGALLWDVGAGCGSIAIEWARAGGRAVAVESEAGRCAVIAANAADLGVPGIAIHQGEAPAALAALGAAPDAVFVGGGPSLPGMLETCWQALRPGGRLVANAVTAEAEAALLAWRAEAGGQMTRIAVSRLAPTGRFQGWKPLMPVTQYVGVKP